ncbi:hypothetical protein [Clostridium ihumii]|uniref:hypothetical protein n=1 Tax=Clostridium ihumii TaxID=1470356 RepID=UPI0013155431|nr:hypothetical protein [Clostridium ihumii]
MAALLKLITFNCKVKTSPTGWFAHFNNLITFTYVKTNKAIDLEFAFYFNGFVF